MAWTTFGEEHNFIIQCEQKTGRDQSDHPVYSFIQHGRRVIWLKLWDPSKTKHDDMMCILYLVVLMLAREPKTQIAGISVISDQTGLCYSHLPSWRMICSYQTLIKVSWPPFHFHFSS